MVSTALDEVLAADILEQEPAGSRTQCLVDERIETECREHEHEHAGSQLRETHAAGRLKPVHAPSVSEIVGMWPRSEGSPGRSIACSSRSSRWLASCRSSWPAAASSASTARRSSTTRRASTHTATSVRSSGIATVVSFLLALVLWNKKLMLWTFVLAVLAEIVQHATALPKHPWVSGLHPVSGVAILGISAWLAHSAWARKGPAPAAETATDT